MSPLAPEHERSAEPRILRRLREQEKTIRI